METKNSLAVYTAPENAIAISPDGKLAIANTAQACHFAMMMGESKMLPPNTSPIQAAIAIIAGASLKIPPFQAVQNIAVINNRPCIWGDALVALAQGSGLVEDEKTEWFTNKEGKRVGCRYLVKRKGRASYYEGEFSLLMARDAGLLSRLPWKQYPQRMLFNRARAFALRNAFADFLMGVNIREEVEDFSDTSYGSGAKRTVNSDALVEHLAKATEPIVIEAPAEVASVEGNPDDVEVTPVVIDEEK
jgi:hypothetical protein